jgi:hypothetical protein
MAKAKKKSITTETPEQLAIRQALRIAYEVDRWQWLCGNKPFVPMMPMTPAPPAPSKKSTERKEGPQERRLTPVFIKCWPPDGKSPPPAELSDTDLIQMAGDEYERRYEGRTVSRNSILRKAGRLPR